MLHRVWRVGTVILCALTPMLALFASWEAERAHARPLASLIIVTSAEDGPANPFNCPGASTCRLRDALAAATPFDVIYFNLPDDSVIVLTDGELVVDTPLAINGASAVNLSISGNNASRVFAAIAQLTIVSLTIEYGNTDGSGGGLAAASPVNLYRVAFLNNTAALDGGGLYAGSTATLSNTTFVSNTSTQGNGGGAFIENAASVKGATFERNAAQRMFAADFGLGGGLVTLAPLDLMDTQFLSNTAGNSAGGLRSAVTATLSNAAFVANSAHFLGAGVMSSGPFYISHGQFLANVAGSDGGGLSALGPAAVTDTQFLSNTALDGAGAFFARDAALNGAQFHANTCNSPGCANGGVFGYSAHSLLALSQNVTTSDDFNIWGDWANSGTFVQTAGTTTFDTYFALSVAGNGSSTFNHVRINPSEGISLFASINVTGDFTNAGKFTPAGGSVTFSGNGAQRIAGSVPTAFGDLAIANTGAGVSLGQDITATNRLTLTSDLTTTDDYTLSLTAGATGAGDGDVWGRVARQHPFSPNTLYGFGSPFVSLNFTGGTPPSAITLDLTRRMPLGIANTVRRAYAITPVGGSGYTARLRLHYRDGELNGNAEGALVLWRYPQAGTWTPYSATGFDSTDNWVEHNNVTALSWWTLSQYAPISRQFLPLIIKSP